MGARKYDAVKAQEDSTAWSSVYCYMIVPAFDYERASTCDRNRACSLAGLLGVCAWLFSVGSRINSRKRSSLRIQRSRKQSQEQFGRCRVMLPSPRNFGEQARSSNYFVLSVGRHADSEARPDFPREQPFLRSYVDAVRVQSAISSFWQRWNKPTDHLSRGTRRSSASPRSSHLEIIWLTTQGPFIRMVSSVKQ